MSPTTNRCSTAFSSNNMFSAMSPIGQGMYDPSINYGGSFGGNSPETA